MKRSLVILLSMLLGVGPSVLVAAQDVVVSSFPSAALIRGEYIRLRAEPAAAAQVILLLERGDEITVTGEARAADGFIFYPVEVMRTGDAGWVRELFIDPQTIAPLLEPAPALEPEPEPVPEEIVPAPEAEEDDARRERPARERPARERRNADAEDQDPAAEEPAAEEPVAQDSEVEEPVTEVVEEPEPEPEPAPEEAEPEPEPEEPADDVVVAVEGEGAMATEPFTLEEGRYRITARLEATEATGFVINLLGPRNFNEPLFEDEIEEAQPWRVRTSISIDRAGEYVIEVAEAAGPWTVEFAAR